MIGWCDAVHICMLSCVEVTLAIFSVMPEKERLQIQKNLEVLLSGEDEFRECRNVICNVVREYLEKE